jgi:hypothetical protein
VEGRGRSKGMLEALPARKFVLCGRHIW